MMPMFTPNNTTFKAKSMFGFIFRGAGVDYRNVKSILTCLVGFR